MNEFLLWHDDRADRVGDTRGPFINMKNMFVTVLYGTNSSVDTLPK